LGPVAGAASILPRNEHPGEPFNSAATFLI
jgi:hypothetical protein